jgi:hypothetical protein
VPPGVVTVTSTVPALAAGDTAVIDVPDTTVMLLAGLLPNETVVTPLTNPVPVMVTVVPPTRGPALGLIELSVGTA